jgi:hypothetical protein
MIKILQEFRKKYGEKIKNDIYLHPSKYIDLWKEYTKNEKDPGTYYVQHKCDDRGKDISHKNMFAPVDYTITVNGTDVALKNKLGLPISTDHLCSRKRYRGYYVVPATGDPYVILLNTPCDVAYAMSSAAVAVTTEGD